MLLGFKKQFTPHILAGTKQFTIRKTRRLKPKIGETLHMYEALRTQHSKFITKEHQLKSVFTITFYYNSLDRILFLELFNHIDFRGYRYGEKYCEDLDLNVFAKRDGFDTWKDFKAYWVDEIKKSDVYDDGDIIHRIHGYTLYSWAPNITEVVNLFKN